MSDEQTIRRLGFRKWYERELIQSHAHLVLLLLSGIGFLGSAEAYSRTLPLGSQLLVLVCALASAVVGVWALRRYLYLLTHAEAVANQAECPHCQTYARFTLVQSDRTQEQVDVQCKKCEHRWHISL